MKMMKKSLMVLALIGVTASVGACSSPPPENQPVKEVAMTVTENKEQNLEVATKEEAPTLEKKEEGIRLVMTEAAGDNKIEGSEGLAFYGVYAEAEDETSIADAISKNHFFATKSEEGPKIKVTAKEYIMGDSAKIEDLVKFKIEVKSMKSGSIVKVVTADGVVEEEKVMGNEYLGRIDAEAKGFYRVEVYTADGELLAVSSPITITQ